MHRQNFHRTEIHTNIMRLFKFNPDSLPGCADAERATVGWKRFQDVLQDTPERIAFAKALASSAAGLKLAQAVFGNSPFLTACWVNDPQFTMDLLQFGPESRLRMALDATRRSAPDLNEADLKRHLRVQKRRIALTTAIADITQVWDLETITHALSDFAEAAVSAACAFHLGVLARRGKIILPTPDDPEHGSGLVVLAMGKLGGRELNYSSDIDLIVLFDPDRVQTDNPQDLGTSFVRLTRGLVSMLEDRTADGYVFRTDLRLRPDPGSTPLALSTRAAEVYYESIGQNWERAAMIKARPIAGDKVAGDAFLKFLTPFVWRKSLDFAAIQDIQSIKRQINSHLSGNRIELLGHNVKLGRGGIREIEFYAQTQQLIWGGREHSLRTIPTLASLNALVAAGFETAENVQVLSEAYTFLRRVEHRLQMVDDAQTHTLPDTDAGLDHISTFLGYDDPQVFADDMRATLGRVEVLYAHLFADPADLDLDAVQSGNLVFTGGESDPDTLKTLADMGYVNVQAIDTTVRGWCHGHYRATRSTRAQQILTTLLPRILIAMANTSEPDVAFLHFDAFLSKLPAGVQLFAMFQSHPFLLDLIADIIGTAPRLAEHLSKKVDILDGVLTPGFFDRLPDAPDMQDDLNQALQDTTCMEEVLDMCRRWAKDQKFQVGVQVLKGTIGERDSQRALTNVAETVLRTLQPRVEDEFAKRHGRVPGGALAVLAFGKLGGREKTPTSDMDLAFVYDCAPEAQTSDGDKPLPVSQYFARLSQRLINALSAPTAQGALYEVDMRLRPSGDAGPVATTLAAFKTYQKDQAWTWEHMALTRARVVTGPDALRHKVQDVITAVLTTPRAKNKLVVDVADMRARMDKGRHTDQIWSIKDYRGGLVDIEFIAQYLQLLHAPTHPQILSPTTRVALENLKHAGLLDAASAKDLLAALDLWHSLQGLLRLTVIKLKDEGSRAFPERLQQRISHIAGVSDVAEADRKFTATATQVMTIFTHLIQDPAQAARPTVTTDLQT